MYFLAHHERLASLHFIQSHSQSLNPRPYLVVFGGEQPFSFSSAHHLLLCCVVSTQNTTRPSPLCSPTDHKLHQSTYTLQRLHSLLPTDLCSLGKVFLTLCLSILFLARRLSLTHI